MTEEKQYLTRGQASEYCIKKGLPVSPKTLAKYACVGGDFRDVPEDSFYRSHAVSLCFFSTASESIKNG